MDGQRELAHAFLGAHPQETARLLEGLPPAAAAELIAELPQPLATPVVEHMESVAAAALLRGLVPEDVAELLAALPAVRAASIVRRAAAVERDAWFARLDRRTGERIRSLLSHSARSAAALADPHALALPGDVTVADAVARIRQAGGGTRTDVYVLSGAQQFEGVVTLHRLLVAEPHCRLDALVDADVEVLSAEADVTALIAHPAWREHRSLAVVDANGVFLGAIDHALVRQLEREATAAAGTQPVLAALLTLGEAYFVGLAGLLHGIVTAVGPSGPATPAEPPR